MMKLLNLGVSSRRIVLKHSEDVSHRHAEVPRLTEQHYEAIKVRHRTV